MRVIMQVPRKPTVAEQQHLEAGHLGLARGQRRPQLSSFSCGGRERCFCRRQPRRRGRAAVRSLNRRRGSAISRRADSWRLE
jgi:hypothetical protein